MPSRRACSRCWNIELRLPEGTDAQQAYGRLRVLEEEDPQLHLRWDARTRQIRVQLMGAGAAGNFAEADRSALRTCMRNLTRAASSISRRSRSRSRAWGTIEPLRHYAEVHLLLEPGEPGSGIQIDTMCSEDALSRNWQRLIFTHLAGEDLSRRADRRAADRCAHHARDGPRAPEAYGGRRFPPGDVPCGAAGPDEGEERPARAVVRRSGSTFRRSASAAR